ncbi:hypothetical protein AK812_SmicGene12496 [Symbiodinium microadriaticum]|uniref:Uncharacterized protein n=1 Tax=Symbiodinium microadriaticum TaxID=2951 RepID=A0A1Q9EAH8_SYMMI|nr:hypothetical protein AK812_SmicGene12496 [Symbiodinium microadriaticum]
MDWPMSSAEKRFVAFALYQREVAATEASLQAAEREIRDLRRDQTAPGRWSISSGPETQAAPWQEALARSQPAPGAPPTPRRRRWSRRSEEPVQMPITATAQKCRSLHASERDSADTRVRAVSWDTGGSQRRERRVPLVSLEQFIGMLQILNGALESQ